MKKNKDSISFAGKTDPGTIRTNNEDAFVARNIWNGRHVLAVAIDGVGGYEGGEEAARIAQETIVAYLEKYPNGERIDLLKQAVLETNSKIFEQREAIPQFANMSCVLTAALVEVDGRRVNMVHVGDTRLYQYRYGVLAKLSHDHSLVGYREEKGDLTEAEAMNHPQRNVISRDVGSETHQIDDDNFLEAVVFPLNGNSTLLLCSDGLCDMLLGDEIASVLQQRIPIEEKAQNLIDCANAKGGKDNITVVLVEYLNDDDDAKEPPSDRQIGKPDGKSPEAVKTPAGDANVPHPEDAGETGKGGVRKPGGLAKTVLFVLLGFALGMVAGWLLHEHIPDLMYMSKGGKSPTPIPTGADDVKIPLMPENSFETPPESAAPSSDAPSEQSSSLRPTTPKPPQGETNVDSGN
jgi:serine/threonine protein phosphatase PrpC